jgi:sugar transferase (PEP-CTERM/EpsH1 system associated)
MKILVLDEEFPYPLNTGKRIRSFNLLSRLAQKHELRYLAYGTPNDDSYQASTNANMNPIAVASQIQKKAGIGFYYKLAMNLLSPRPYIVTSHYSKLFQQEVNRQTEQFKPDAIICEWTPYGVFVESISSTKKIIVAHNIESTIWQRYYENERSLLKRWYTSKQYRKVMAFENEVVGWVDGVTTVSEKEAAVIRQMRTGLNVTVIDNGVDLSYFQPTQTNLTGKKLVFTGSMDWRPNQDAVQYFADELLPVFKQQEPSIEATFVGRNPPEHINKLDGVDGITITGTVDDVRPYIDQASAYIVPLRIGGGSRLKILEAFAMKKPVISTTVGAEGLDVTDGENILLADDPETFVKRVRQVLSDPDLARRLGANGRKLVEQQYGWDALAGKLENFLIKVVGGV